MGTQLNVWEREKTGHTCSDCEGDALYLEEVFLIHIMQPQVVGGQVVFHNIIDEDDPHGDFLFQPFFFCFECWENHYHELQEAVRDEPPVSDEFSAIECSCCGSGIREWEYTGVFTLGEFHVSKRAPNNFHGPKFVPNGKPETLCLYCLSIINDNYIAMWDDLSQEGECGDCLLIRCWRHPEGCGCGCHTEDTETDDNEQD